MATCELVLQFRGPRVETEDEVAEIEDVLIEILGDGETWQGHEISADSRNILIATDDAQATLARLRPFLERAGLFEHMVATTRPASGT